MNRRTKITIGIVIVSVVLIGAAVAGFFVYQNMSKTEDTQKEGTAASTYNYEKINNEISSTGTSDADLSALVKDYGPQYDAAMADIRKVTPDKWSPDQVNEAYLCFIYADKIGLYSQVIDLYYQIASAEQSGVNVDANSAHLSKATRDEMKAKADAAQSNGSPLSGELQQ